MATRDLVLSEELLSDDLLRVAVGYLSQVVKDESTEVLARYSRMAKDANILAASVAIDAIGRHPAAESVAVLLELYDEVATDDLRGAVLRALGETGSAEALPMLTEIASDEYQIGSLRQYAADSLGKIGMDESFAVLVSLTAAEDALLRAYAVHAVGYYDSPEAAEILIGALRDSFWRVRVSALQGLAERKWTDAAPAVAYKARRDPERPVRQAAITTMIALADDVSVQTLTDIARSVRTGESERIQAILGLYEVDLAGSIDFFQELVSEEWERENSRILDAVGKRASESDDPVIEPIVGRLLSHPNFIIRIYGIRGAGRAGLVSYVPILKEFAEDSSPGIVRDSTVAALERLGVEYDPAAETDSDGELPSEPAPEDSLSDVPSEAGVSTQSPLPAPGTEPGAESEDTW
ncbi:MAG: HEAT repeat domain-containing protein [Spirochaetales bacterium]|nr:MAG: HEAT repeat domain-containing protein [Spirochaetales bacterium]